MDAALDKVAAAVDKAEPAVEKAVRSALGDKAGDAVHAAAEKVKESLKDEVSANVLSTLWTPPPTTKDKTANLLSLSPLSQFIPIQQQTKRAQISEVAGKAQAKVQELVGEAKK